MMQSRIRPNSKFREEYPEMLIEHMKTGRSYATFAAKIGIHRDALYRWEKSHPEWKEAKEMAFNANLAWLEDTLIWGIKNKRDFEFSAWKFEAINRHRDQYAEQAPQAPINIISLNKTERVKLLQEIRDEREVK